MAKKYFVHKSADVEKGARIGEGTSVWHYSHISKGAIIGKNCKIGQNVFVGNDVRIGSNVKIQNNVSVYDGITLEDNVFCGPSAVFTNVINPRSEYPRDRKKEFKATLVKRGASIGANATIVCGNEIGGYAFIGAGAVITKDVPPYALAYGNPARIHGWICECGEKLNFNIKYAKCSVCNKRYKKLNAKSIAKRG